MNSDTTSSPNVHGPFPALPTVGTAGINVPSESCASEVAAAPDDSCRSGATTHLLAYPPATVPVWGLPFARVDMEQTVAWVERLVATRQPSYLITANLNWVMLSHQRPELRAVNQDAAGLIADGMPIVWRSRLERGTDPLPTRVAGSELIYRLAQRGDEKQWRVYLTGGAPGVAERTAERLLQQYPGLRIVGCDSPPFRPLSPEEQQEHLRRIRDAETDLLFVAFGQPKGELWIHQHYRQLGHAVCIQLGASFDFIAGTAKRAPRGWQRLGLEWAYRMAHDPKRLVPRYWSNLRFLTGMLLLEAVCGSQSLGELRPNRMESQ